ncbi:MAG: DEAD/DEAH box helicase [Acidobacteria bacterium]|nr:DEAD/DEAH box helicase [Acidobacteriota bacterium]MYD71833.1 DEAD/DEAH box helicase [Acidobacteriota bacterium]MYJ03385.1 DEAD/DEAH box helicase [Acidobacteriota bacterium]
MHFADLGLHPELLRAVDRAGYKTSTPIQARAIPAVLQGHDLIACAQTGTGKTAAFLLPILQRLADRSPGSSPRALVITPTRELAAQIAEAARQYGRDLRLRSTVIFGGVGMEPQTRRLRAGLDLLVATPGRLLDHLGRGHARLDRVETLVLDEADRMLDMGFLPDIRRILKVLPKTRQNLFFSATMPDEIEALIRRTATNPTVIEVTRRATPVSAIKQVVHPVVMTSKKDLLTTLLQRADMGPTLVFTRTKARANQLVRRLEKSRRQVAAIHGNKSQSARTRALAGFRAGRIDTLIATDIAARGIDVEGISHVINFDLPHVPEDYVHRIGRTARAGSSGHAVSLAAPEERLQLAAIERLVGNSIPREKVAGFDATLDAAPPEGRRQPRRRKTGSRQRGSNGHTRAAAPSRPRTPVRASRRPAR